MSTVDVDWQHRAGDDATEYSGIVRGDNERERASAVLRHGRSASMPSIIVDVTTEQSTSSPGGKGYRAERKPVLLGRTRRISLSTASGYVPNALHVADGFGGGALSAAPPPLTEWEIRKGRMRSQSLWSDRETRSADERRRPAERSRALSMWSSMRILGYRLARFVFYPPEPSPGQISYTSSTSGGSGSESDTRRGRKRAGRRRRSERTFSLDCGKALAPQSRTALGSVALSKADSMLSMSSLVDESVSPTPDDVYDASSSSQSEADDLVREQRMEPGSRPWTASTGFDLESAQPDTRFYPCETNEGVLPAQGGSLLRSTLSFMPNLVKRCMMRAADVFQTLFVRGVSVQPPLREELTARHSWLAKGLFLAQTAIWYLWPVLAWLLVFNFFDLIPGSWKPHQIHVRWIPILESYLYYPHRWFFFGYDNGRGANFLDFLAAFPYTVHAGLPFAFIVLLIWRRTPARRILQFGRLLGLVSLFAVITHLFLPTAPPWYYEKFGFRPPSYSMKGDPALLDRIDDEFGVRFYKTMYATAGKVVFGTFPSLHAAWPYLMAIFEPQQGRFLWAYVLWVWWAALYLQHHYLLDLVGGAIYAEFFYALCGRLSEMETEAALDKTFPTAADGHGEYQPVQISEPLSASRHSRLQSDPQSGGSMRPLTPVHASGTSRPLRRYRSSSQASSIDQV
ncbi:hypothetical protein CCYA_CCYA16G4192 [Cyanidiococcus yangmingshanensis]|nr:hypothetical protein CCYA_CCYA16G4192 [Cyanidiococcus yangmingshanensis]